MLMAWSSILGFALLKPADAERVERAISTTHTAPADSLAADH
jgi:hypothetical protein